MDQIKKKKDDHAGTQVGQLPQDANGKRVRGKWPVWKYEESNLFPV